MTVDHCLEQYVDHGIEGCIVDKANELEKATLFVIGDSHSRHLLGILKNYPGKVIRLKVSINELNNKIIGHINRLTNNKISNLLLAYRFNTKAIDDIHSLNISIGKISNPLNKIFIIRDIPSHKVDPVACVFAYNSNLKFKKCKYDPFIKFPLKEVENHDSQQWQLIKMEVKQPTTLIDTHELMCNEDECKLVFNEQFIMRDHNHFNENLHDKTNKELYNALFRNIFE
jgi:hypothetical protein